MSALILPNRLTQQPQWAAQVDLSNTIAQDAAIIINAISNGLNESNLVTGYNCIGSGTALTRTVGKQGRAYTSAGNQLVMTDFNFNVGAGDFTVAVVARSNANNTADYYIVVNPSASNAALRIGNGGLGTWQWSTANVFLDSGIPINVNKPQAVVFTRRKGINYFCIDGVLVNLGANTDSFASGNVGLFSRNGTTNTLPYFGDLFLFVGAKRSWSDTEMLSWSANPWQLFKAPPRRLWLASSTPTGTGTGSAAGTSTALATGAATIASTASAAGTSTASATGSATASATASSAGTSTAAAVSSAASSATASSAGTSTAAATSSASTTATATAASAGTSTASSTGAASAAATGIATGTSTATATGAATSATTASASGTSTAAAVNGTAAGNAGTAAGTSTAIATSAVLVSSSGTASGTSTASAASAYLLSAVGTATGASTAQAFSPTTATAIGTAAGSSTAAGTSPNAVGGGYYDDDKPKKKKHIVKQGEQLFVFDSKQAAERAMRQFAEDENEESQRAIETVAEQVIALPQVKKYAKQTGSIKQFNAAQNSNHYADILAMFEQMREEEDLEVLLMSL